MDEEQKKFDDETSKSLLEHELMALYTHAPYLGEWGTFIKIGDALNETYGKLEPESINHDDGISFNDLYWITKNEENITEEIPIPMESNLKFNVRPIESIKIREHGRSSFAMNRWIELNDDNYNDNIIPMNICRLGGVQKSISISKCVPRVQGPIFYDNKMKMRGSTTFMAPKNDKYNGIVGQNNNNNNKIDTILPKNTPLNGVNDFIEVRQIEEWDLKPVEEGNINELEGIVKIRREPVNIDDKCDTFEIQYDCILKLSPNTQDYY